MENYILWKITLHFMEKKNSMSDSIIRFVERGSTKVHFQCNHKYCVICSCFTQLATKSVTCHEETPYVPAWNFLIYDGIVTPLRSYHARMSGADFYCRVLCLVRPTRAREAPRGEYYIIFNL